MKSGRFRTKRRWSRRRFLTRPRSTRSPITERPSVMTDLWRISRRRKTTSRTTSPFTGWSRSMRPSPSPRATFRVSSSAGRSISTNTSRSGPRTSPTLRNTRWTPVAAASPPTPASSSAAAGFRRSSIRIRPRLRRPSTTAASAYSSTSVREGISRTARCSNSLAAMAGSGMCRS